MSSTTVEQLNAELSLNFWPRFNALNHDSQSLCCELYIPESLCYFEGHFPSQAVLPGVVQVHWAGELARRFFSVHHFCDMKSIKFNNMVLPGADVTLKLAYQMHKATVKFEYRHGADIYSSGNLVFGSNA